MAKGYELSREELKAVQLRALLFTALIVVLAVVGVVAAVMLMRSPDTADSPTLEAEMDKAYVYVMPGSSVYHRVGCPKLTGQRKGKMSLKAALAYQYQPCPECDPPRDIQEVEGAESIVTIAPGATVE